MYRYTITNLVRFTLYSVSKEHNHSWHIQVYLGLVYSNATPKSSLNPLKTCSRKFRYGVRKNPRRTHLRGFFFYQNFKIGHFWSRQSKRRPFLRSFIQNSIQQLHTQIKEKAERNSPAFSLLYKTTFISSLLRPLLHVPKQGGYLNKHSPYLQASRCRP